MLQKVLTFAACLVMASAVSVSKCGNSHKPFFLSQKDGVLESAEESNMFGQVEKDLEKDIASMVPILAQGGAATKGEMEAAFGGIVGEAVDEVAKAGGVQ